MRVSFPRRTDARFDVAWGEVTGAVGDTVTVLPIVVAVAALTDLSLGRLLLGFAVFQVVWGLYYGHPMSVEPMKALAALPIAGFKHSVGNLYYLPMAGILSFTSPEFAGGVTVSLWGALRNLSAVTLGNIAGGGGMVAMVYHLIYRRPRKIRLERIEENQGETNQKADDTA